MTTKILTGAYAAGYTLNPSFDAVTITHTASVGGTGLTANQLATVAVLGTIDAANENGIALNAGGAVTVGNAGNMGASVEGRGYAIYAQNAAATIVNHATISTANQTLAILLADGGKFTNTGDAGTGISIEGGTGTVVNSGDIAGPRIGLGTYYNAPLRIDSYQIDPAVTLGDGGSVLNQATGVLNSGIDVAAGAASVRNDGTIYGTSFRYYGYEFGDPAFRKFDFGQAIYFKSSGTLTNNGTVKGSVVNTTGALTVTNSGTITGAYVLDTVFNYQIPGNSIEADDGGKITNTGTIFNAVYVKGGAGTVINRGAMGALLAIGGPGVQSYGIELKDGGTVANGTAAATTAAINWGVYIGPTPGTVTNFGSISNGYFGVTLYDGGTVTNGSATDSAAYIEGATVGVKFVAAAGTITNFGTIQGGNYAVNLEFGGTLIEEGSGKLIGNVYGFGGTLELGGKAGAGTLAGLGSTITSFNTITIDAKSTWTLSGADIEAEATMTDLGALTIAGGLVNNGEIDLSGSVSVGTTDASTLTNSNLLKMTVAGTSTISTAIDNAATIEVAGGTLDLKGAVTDTGTLQIDSGQRLRLDASVASTQTVDFDGTGDRLTLSDTANFSAPLSGFAAGDQLILTEFGKGTTLGFLENGGNTQGTLTVTQGALQATINLLGQYAAAGFHLTNASGGEIVTYAPLPEPLSVLAHPGV